MATRLRLPGKNLIWEPPRRRITDDGSRPIFRSFAPVTSPSRTFPRLQRCAFGLRYVWRVNADDNPHHELPRNCARQPDRRRRPSRPPLLRLT